MGWITKNSSLCFIYVFKEGHTVNKVPFFCPGIFRDADGRFFVAASWYRFACKIIEYAGKYEKFPISVIKPIKSSEYQTAATRPKRSVLNCDKIFSCFGIEVRRWDLSLEEMIGEYYQDRCR